MSALRIAEFAVRARLAGGTQVMPELLVVSEEVRVGARELLAVLPAAVAGSPAAGVQDNLQALLEAYQAQFCRAVVARVLCPRQPEDRAGFTGPLHILDARGVLVGRIEFAPRRGPACYVSERPLPCGGVPTRHWA